MFANAKGLEIYLKKLLIDHQQRRNSYEPDFESTARLCGQKMAEHDRVVGADV